VVSAQWPPFGMSGKLSPAIAFTVATASPTPPTVEDQHSSQVWKAITTSFASKLLSPEGFSTAGTSAVEEPGKFPEEELRNFKGVLETAIIDCLIMPFTG